MTSILAKFGADPSNTVFRNTVTSRKPMVSLLVCRNRTWKDPNY